jgi:superoxide dismutase, Fe-Mn family
MEDITHVTRPFTGAKTQFSLPKLPFAEDALAPYISAETIQFHYGKHHAKYVDETNKLLIGSPLAGQSLEEIVKNAEGPLFNNAAQNWNHSFFWNCLTPHSKGPSERMNGRISEKFGSVDEFKTEFSETAVKLFGSGWAWLVLDENDELAIQPLPDAGNPLKKNQTPLLALDVWEHAYYLDYQNDRKKFVENFWKLANWDFVEQNCFGRH